MKKLTLLFVTVCAVFLLASTVRAEFSVSGYAGIASPMTADVTDTSGDPANDWEELDFDSGTSFGAKGTYWFTDNNSPHIGLQLDLNNHVVELDTLTLYSGISHDFSSSVEMVVSSAAANLMFRIPDGSIRPYVGVGVGIYSAEIDDGILGGSSAFNGDDDNAFGYQGIIGAEIPIRDNMGIFVEGRFSAVDFEFGGATAAMDGVELDIDYRVLQFHGGFTFYFN